MANGGHLREVGGAARSSERDREICRCIRQTDRPRDSGREGPVTENGGTVREMKALLTWAGGGMEREMRIELAWPAWKESARPPEPTRMRPPV